MRYLCSPCAANAKVNLISIIACGIFFIIMGVIVYAMFYDVVATVISLCAGLLIAFIGISSLYMTNKTIKCREEEFYDAHVKVHIDANAVFLEMDPNKRE